jgi:type I restriction enzyme M protein
LGLWDGLKALEKKYESYLQAHNGEAWDGLAAEAIDQQNKVQRQLSEEFEPFFGALHVGLKRLDKTVRMHEAGLMEKAKQENGGKRVQIDRQVKALKTTLEELHTEVKSAESFLRRMGRRRRSLSRRF